MNGVRLWSLAWTLCLRGLRGSWMSLWVLWLCMALGVGAVASVGGLRLSLLEGLSREGAVLLGGDLEVRVPNMSPETRLLDVLDSMGTVSDVVDLRSMAVSGETRGLVQVKAVDDVYPLYGEVVLASGRSWPEVRDLPFAAVVERDLLIRLGLEVGDRFTVAGQEWVVEDILVSEPDIVSQGLQWGPRVMVSRESLDLARLTAPGSLFSHFLRVRLDDSVTLAQARALVAPWQSQGFRVRDSRRAAPEIEAFVDRFGRFLVVVGLTSLVVGGVGVFAATQTLVLRRTPAMAMLRAMGARGGLVWRTLGLEILLLTLAGVILGLTLGTVVPLVASAFLSGVLPVTLALTVFPQALIEAALSGLILAFLFAFLPLVQAMQVLPAHLFRRAVPLRFLDLNVRQMFLFMSVLTVFVVGLFFLSGEPLVGLSTFMAVVLTLWVLGWTSALLTSVARLVSRRPVSWPPLRWTVSALASGASDVRTTIVALGLGLMVLSGVGQIHSNLRTAIASDLPQEAPAFFVLDVSQADVETYEARVMALEGVSDVRLAPMLRGTVRLINGAPARSGGRDHWTLRGDRGITYAAVRPEGARVVAGRWWSAEHDGPPEVMFLAEAAREIGLSLGDVLTVNILGRDVDLVVAGFQDVDFSQAGMGFTMTVSPNAVAGAPHNFLSTIYATRAAEESVLREIAASFPDMTFVSVRDVIARVASGLEQIALAVLVASGFTLAVGLVVLVSAQAAGQQSRVRESAILFSLGTPKIMILKAFLVRTVLVGAFAGLVALACGTVLAWWVVSHGLSLPFSPDPFLALGVVCLGVVLSTVSGIGFARAALRGDAHARLRADS